VFNKNLHILFVGLKFFLWGSAGGSFYNESAAVSDIGTNVVSLKRMEF
jgi:hypothetical protein